MSFILLTRPEPGLSETKNHLEALGHKVRLAPMQQIKELKVTIPVAAAYVITSPKAVTYGLSKVANKSTPIFAVGKSSAKAAEAAGFTDVSVGEGYAKALLPAIDDHLKGNKGIVLHLSGVNVVLDIAAELVEAGYKAKRLPCYDTLEVITLPDEVILALTQEKISTALFYSAQALSIFERRVEENGLTEKLASIRLLTLSKRIEEAATLSWGQTKSARRPVEDNLFELIN